jgi:hypothetical protein
MFLLFSNSTSCLGGFQACTNQPLGGEGGGLNTHRKIAKRIKANWSPKSMCCKTSIDFKSKTRRDGKGASSSLDTRVDKKEDMVNMESEEYCCSESVGCGVPFC